MTKTITKLIKELDEMSLSFSIFRNDFKTYYQTCQQDINMDDPNVLEDFKNKEDCKKCVKDDSVWCVICYPDTPVGFHNVYGSELKEVLERMIKTIKEERKVNK